MSAPADGEENDGQQFDRLPETAVDRVVAGRAAREEVLDWWQTRFGVPPETFDGFSFWEKGAGKIWVFAGEAPHETSVEGLGMTFLRTRQEHWKPTTVAVQRFGHRAMKNVVHLSTDEATRFAAGEDQPVEWDGDWGYLIATREVAGEPAPLGVGLYLHGELRSVVPKGTQERLPE
jgi:NOL1/NOP2/fmu family ribosome biogenesis protein